jgi:hypothetical protein
VKKLPLLLALEDFSVKNYFQIFRTKIIQSHLTSYRPKI